MPIRRALMLAAAVTLCAGAAPAVPIISAEPLVAAAHPYDETADAHAQLAAALAEAQRSGKHVMLDFGGNWCPDCRVLAGILERPEVKPWFEANYIEVAVDVGRRTKNMDIAQHYGLALEAVPSVLVLSPDGKPVNRDAVLALGDARSMVPQAVVALLARWCGSAPATN
jgi:thiol:disulfide interchange protein